jgi:hypothetical protein
MELGPYVDNLRRDLATAAEAASSEVRDAADRLSYAVEPSLRMVLLEALGVAAAEVTDQLTDVVVEVRLRGRDPELVVTEHAAPSPGPPAPPVPPPPPPPEVEEGMARVSLRLPESLKARVDEAAVAAGQSANAWIVRSITQVLDAGPAAAATGYRVRGVGQRLAGWQR